MKKLIASGAALLIVVLMFYPPVVAWAQQEVLLTGQDSSGNTRIVKTDSTGTLLTTAATASSSSSSTSPTAHAACTNTTMNVGTTGTACPAVRRADRSSITIQLVQSGETLTVTSDGVTAATATVGLQIGNTDIFSDDLIGTVDTNCRCTAATCSVRILECP